MLLPAQAQFLLYQGTSATTPITPPGLIGMAIYIMPASLPTEDQNRPETTLTRTLLLGRAPLLRKFPVKVYITSLFYFSHTRLTPSIAVSPVISSGNSASSTYSDNLELSNSKHSAHRPQPVVYAENDFLEQLHTSTHRKLGEAPVYTSPPTMVRPVLDAVVQNGRPSKSRWSMMGRKNAVGIAV